MIQDPYEQFIPSRAKAHRLGQQASELKCYQDEPPQMRSGVVGKSGYLKLRFGVGPYRSELVEMTRRVPLLVQKALYWDETMPYLPCVTLISTAGAVVQGDRLAIDVIVEANACAHLTSQSATKIHSMDANYATQVQHIIAQENTYVEFMPGAIIPHRNARFITETTLDVHPTATLLYAEIIQSGRKYHHKAEKFGFDVFSSTLRANAIGVGVQTELFVEKYILEPKINTLSCAGVMADFDIMGNLIVLTPSQYQQSILQRCQPKYEQNQSIAYGVSLLPNRAGLIFKVLATKSQSAKQAMYDFWKIAREEILQLSVPDPFLWR